MISQKLQILAATLTVAIVFELSPAYAAAGWVDSNKVDISLLEIAGKQLLNGAESELYLVRAMHRQLALFAVGRYSNTLQKGWFSYRGDEVEFEANGGKYHDFFVASQGEVEWIQSNSQLRPPSNAVSGGMDPEVFREVQVCRYARDKDNLIPGKYLDVLGSCVYSFDGQEFEGHQYELLVYNNNTEV